MPHDTEEITVWIEKLGQGNSQAAEVLWQRYFDKLVRFARKKLDGLPRRVADEEDVGLSAMHSFCRGMRIAILLLLTFSGLLAGCGTRRAPPAGSGTVLQEKEPADFEPTEETPRFWQDQEAAEVIEMLKYSYTRVYRWRNGAVEAWGGLDGEDGEPWRFTSVGFVDKRLPDPRRTSGTIVVAIQPKDDGGCQVVYIGVNVRAHGGDDKAEEGRLMRVKSASSNRWSFSQDDNSASIDTYEGDEEEKVNLMTIEFSAP